MEQESGGAAQLNLSLTGAEASSTQSDAQRQSVRCAHCGTAVSLSAWLQDTGMALQFCNVTCRQAWARTEESFAVRLDRKRSRHRRGGNWQIQAREARYRDECRCQECGVSEAEMGRKLHVHHRIPYRRFHSNVEANKLEHLISVCAACHQRLEAQLRRDLPLFAASDERSASD
ncbi:MAG: hypothetical protein CME24_14060 [Gemmatimonadetes bacterium]|nr:hypothetical protein [Gemmatimonadota bacterium]